MSHCRLEAPLRVDDLHPTDLAGLQANSDDPRMLIAAGQQISNDPGGQLAGGLIVFEHDGEHRGRSSAPFCLATSRPKVADNAPYVTQAHKPGLGRAAPTSELGTRMAEVRAAFAQALGYRRP